ncbi:Hok/Gef family protein [Serratia proteamaculans]|uniref:Hok/Gef family protein n=1 Tax=Serratia proteamaculans TaxID=28151 RepID=UPI0039AFC58B
MLDDSDISLINHNIIRGYRVWNRLLQSLRVLETVRLGHCVARRIDESPKLTINQNGAALTPRHRYGSPFTARRQAMYKKHALYALTVVCITVLVFIWMIKDRFCGLEIYQKDITILMTLTCM